MRGSAWGVGIGVGGRIVNRDALLGGEHIAHAGAHLDHNLLARRDLRDAKAQVGSGAPYRQRRPAELGQAQILEVLIEGIGDHHVVHGAVARR